MDTIEIQRKKLQDSLDAQKAPKDRNIMGQYSTPYPLALDIMKYMKTLVDEDTVSLFEPSVGTGVFYSAFKDVFGASKKALGIEIDSHYYKPASQFWAEYPIEIRHEDFFNAQPDCQFPLLVANPPYVRHHHIDGELKCKLQKLTTEKVGVKISGLSGLYCYFLILSEKWLQNNGVSCWLIPSEFMDVNYGQSLKHYLLHNVDLIRIHRFHSDDLQFADALVSSCIVVFRKTTPSNDNEICFSIGGSINSPHKTRIVKKTTLSAKDKWTGFFEECKDNDKCTTTIGNYFTVKRGIVTGNNDFFLLNRPTIEKYGIDASFLRPILPSPRYIKGDIVESVGDLSSSEHQQFLFSCDLSEETLKNKYPGTWDYIQYGESIGVPNGYICSRRTPWYSCEDRSPASIVVPYMGRSDAGNRMFRFILNTSKALTTNVYLLLYPKPQYAYQLSNHDMLLKVWKALNSIPSERMARGGRFYGGGLRKMEPKELMNIPVSEIGNIMSQPSLNIQLPV